MTVLTLGFNPQVSWDVSIGGLTRTHKDLSTYLNSYFNKSLSQLLTLGVHFLRGVVVAKSNIFFLANNNEQPNKLRLDENILFHCEV